MESWMDRQMEERTDRRMDRQMEPTKTYPFGIPCMPGGIKKCSHGENIYSAPDKYFSNQYCTDQI